MCTRQARAQFVPIVVKNLPTSVNALQEENPPYQRVVLMAGYLQAKRFLVLNLARLPVPPLGHISGYREANSLCPCIAAFVNATAISRTIALFGCTAAQAGSGRAPQRLLQDSWRTIPWDDTYTHDGNLSTPVGGQSGRPGLTLQLCLA